MAAILCLVSLPGLAQTAPPTTVLGQVEWVDAASRTLKMKTEDGATLSVSLSEKATVVKVAPGEKSLQNAAPIDFSGITAGDRVLVRGGTRTETPGIEGALRVIVMAKTDLLARNDSDQRAWRERAVVGTVTSVDPAKGEFTLRVSSAAPTATAAIPPAGAAAPSAGTLVVDAKAATLHRYSDLSAKFDDAKRALVQDIAEGDQLRLLGTRSADGSRMTADRVVFGSFKTRALSIEKVDALTGLLEVKDLESNQKFSISVVAGGSIRRIPAEMGLMLAAMSGAGGSGRPGGFRPEGAGAPGGASAGQPPGGMGPHGSGMGGRDQSGAGPRAGRGMQDMVERMPAITLADLKKNDWVGAVVSRIDASGKAVAFNILAGIEVFASRANRSGGVDVGMPPGLLDGGLGVP